MENKVGRRSEEWGKQKEWKADFEAQHFSPKLDIDEFLFWHKIVLYRIDDGGKLGNIATVLIHRS